MLDWPDVRALARAHRRLADGHGPGVPGWQDVDAALARSLSRNRLNAATIGPMDGFGTNVLGALDRSSRLIFSAPHLGAKEARLVRAHEFAHYVLHADLRLETTTLPHATEHGRCEGYSEHALAERQAECFAAEYLCPTDQLLKSLAEHGSTPASVAWALGLPPDLVMRQTVRAFATEAEADEVPRTSVPRAALQAEQALAADRMDGNLLVEGPPGSGRTTACIARVAALLRRGTSPASIALVCVDGAAARRTRALALAADPGALQTWCGTLRGLALEIICACPSRMNRSDRFQLVDDAGALAAIAVSSASSSGDAAKALREYRLRRKAPRTLEPEASIPLEEREGMRPPFGCAAYERHLQENDLVDPGDLVPSAVDALEDPIVAAMAASRFAHVVIDDFGEASAVDQTFVQRLARLGIAIFAAGDARASITRFNGARPEGLTSFESDFAPAARIALRRRAHASPSLEAAIKRFLTGAKGTDVVPGPHRRRIVASVAPTLEGEAAAIAERIVRLRASGIPYGRQAVLARSHRLVARLATLLRGNGIPVAHLGEIAERPEILDLISVLETVHDAGRAFERVAALPVYGVSGAEAADFRRWASTRGLGIPDALALLRKRRAPKASAGLTRMAEDLRDMGPSTTPWTVLTTWLFERGGREHHRGTGTAQDTSAREAIRLVLGVCDEQLRLGDPTVVGLLSRLRRIRAIGQETRFHEDMLDDDGTDRVKTMTIHASRGRQFDAVHVAGVVEGRLPAVRRTAQFTDPWLDPGGVERHLDEERAVFAIAITRAVRHLHLSRAERYGRAAARSRFVSELGDTVREQLVGEDGLARSSSSRLSAAARSNSDPYGSKRGHDRK